MTGAMMRGRAPQSLLAFTTEFMYSMVCRGLFEAHKPIFSFLIATAIQRAAGDVTPDQCSALLRGAPRESHPAVVFQSL